MINRKRIRKIEPYVRLIPDGKHVYVASVSPSPAQLRWAGFTEKLEDGETVLPNSLGPISSFNSVGKEVVHKDQPMETAYRTVEWHWTEWHGPYEVEKSDFVDVPYKRYPRTHVEPPSMELELYTDTHGNRVVLSKLISDWQQHKESLVHATNLLLELFGGCTFFDENRNQVIIAPLVRVNWKILPPGERPYGELRKELDEVVKKVKPGNRSFVEHRLDRLNGFKPKFTAIGQGGFTGYVVFGFPESDTYILESILYGNATYVFDKDWKSLSKKTKAEILRDNLHKNRIIHLKNWFRKIKELLG